MVLCVNRFSTGHFIIKISHVIYISHTEHFLYLYNSSVIASITLSTCTCTSQYFPINSGLQCIISLQGFEKVFWFKECVKYVHGVPRRMFFKISFGTYPFKKRIIDSHVNGMGQWNAVFVGPPGVHRACFV